MNRFMGWGMLVSGSCGSLWFGLGIYELSLSLSNEGPRLFAWWVLRLLAISCLLLPGLAFGYLGGVLDMKRIQRTKPDGRQIDIP